MSLCLQVEEFQWPQRSQSLAQLPAEKLPPKKKRLRLAEAAQSSGESSFESASLPRSPSQESSLSHASSRSASFEESGGKVDAEMQPALMVAHMLTVPPGPHPNREMRRSASEQAPPGAQHPTQIAEARSKSFDYSCLSPQRSAAAWKERRKCLLVKHATLGEAEPDEPPPNPDLPHPAGPLPSDPGSSSRLSPKPSGTSPQLPPSGYPQSSPGAEGFPQGQMYSAAGPQAFPPLHPAQLCLAERLGLPVQPFPPLLPLGYPSGAAQALYLPLPSGLALKVPPDPAIQESKPSTSQSPPMSLHPLPVISPCLEQLSPVVSLVVPVRLQAHMPTYARAMYTTLSQILAPSPALTTPVCCTASWVIMSRLEGGEKKPRSPYLKVPTPDFQSRLSVSLALESGAGVGAGPGMGVGGSKRMLSPAGSLELSTEAQRQQKRVKEEEDEEEDDRGDEGSTTVKKEEGEVAAETIAMPQESELPTWEAKEEEDEEVAERKDPVPELIMVKVKEEEEDEGQRMKSPTYPSLNTTTSVSWCYLNYVKPNPSPQQDPQASVYASWSVSVHNPNLPGLSTRAALSLLQSKQKYTSETYTMANAPHPTTSRLVPASSHKPRMSEVIIIIFISSSIYL